MKLRDLLKLLKDCVFMVRDLDSELRTDYIPSWETGNTQLRTLLDKVVKVIRMPPVPEASAASLIVEVADA